MINIEDIYNEYGKNNVKLNYFDQNIFPFFTTYITSLNLFIDDLTNIKNGDKPYNKESEEDEAELKRLKTSERKEDILKLSYWGRINRLKVEYIEANRLNYIGIYKNYKIEYKDGKLK